MENFTRISISFNTELLDDIFFELAKEHGKIDPKKALSKYLNEKLRPIVPHRNVQVGLVHKPE